MDRHNVRVSKLLALMLRHDPGRFGITLDDGGWAAVDDVVAALAAAGLRVGRNAIETIVAENDKRRFEIDTGCDRMRARQGHSVVVDLGLEPTCPPRDLYHGTVARFVESIRTSGIVRGERQHVHLSPTPDLARQVGSRRGKPVVLRVAAGRLHESGHSFYLSANGVWLTDYVPPQHIEFPD